MKQRVQYYNDYDLLYFYNVLLLKKSKNWGEKYNIYW